MPPVSPPPVLLERHANGVALVTLNRPARRNAVDGMLAEALGAIVDELDADPAMRAVVLAGAGKAFCAGGDLKAISEAGSPFVTHARGAGFAGFVLAPRNLPWIAAVDGPAVGGGFEIVLACDLVVASSRAHFVLPEVQIGAIASGGGAIRAPRRLPVAVATRMLLTAEPLSAQRAFELGLVTDLVPAGQAVEAALRLASTIAAKAPLSVRATLAVIRRSVEPDIAALFAFARATADALAASDDALEGRNAFLERRAPAFNGR